MDGTDESQFAGMMDHCSRPLIERDACRMVADKHKRNARIFSEWLNTIRDLMLAGFCLLLCCQVATADEKPIRLPMTPGVVPEPGPVAGAVDKLEPDSLYIVTADVGLIILQSPDGGLVRITAIESPMSVFAKFADGNGQFEFRKYTDKFIYALSPIKSGTCELLLIPQGVEDADAIVRQTLTVSGVGPQPPPVPGPGPEPKPDPEPQPTVKNVSLAIVEDTMNRSPDTAILMNQLVAWTEFVDAGNDWRAYDLKTKETRGKQAITDLNGPVPGIVIYDRSTRKMIHRGDVPATFGDLKALVGRLTGG